jgi:hypothetical protein
MAEGPEFRTKPILHYLLYIALIGTGIVVLIYMLMHAHPMMSPKVKDPATSQVMPGGVHMERTSFTEAGFVAAG